MVRQRMINRVKAIWNFYIEGFREMTWGRQLWWLILLKVVILFVLLRGFFFRPTLAGKSEEQRIEYIGEQLTKNQTNNLNQN
ncbi:MAG: DUF4492 domain-containing protein [Rikenellaceae bacterium]|nr:DUF4492 domain-containing protein [Rikenellaceae bacterium]